MGLGLEVGVGEGVKAVGLSRFVCCGSARFVWVGIWLGFALSCVFGCGGCGGGCWLLAEGC